MMPENASQYLTTLECGESISYDVNNDGLINSSDLTSLMIYTFCIKMNHLVLLILTLILILTSWTF